MDEIYIGLYNAVGLCKEILYYAFNRETNEIVSQSL